MDYGEFDHPPFFAEPVWPQTLRRWRREGLPADKTWDEVLGVDVLDFAGHGFNHAAWPPFEKKVLEETDEHVIYVDGFGRTVRDLKASMSMPEWLDLPIKDRASFEAMLERFDPSQPQRRLPEDWPQRVRRFNAPDFDALLLPPAGNYFFTMDAMMGVQTAAFMFVDSPDLVHRMFENTCRMCCWFLERVFAEVRGVRAVGTGEDLAYRNGPFFSPEMFEEFFAPRYRRVVDIARRGGAEHFFVDTDGNFQALLPQMLGVGMTIFCPMEVAAGMDPVAIRRRFGPGVRMVGGVDKRIVAAGKEAISGELDRLLPLMCEGGFIPKIDHSVSSDISWDSFRWYIEALWEMHRRCASR
jgi:uroporphyrinogen decarboxylase